MVKEECLEPFILSEKDRKSLHELLAVGYIPREPVCVGMGATAKELLPFIGGLADRGLDSDVSIAMREKSSGKMVAVMTNFIVTPGDSEIFEDATYEEEKCKWYSDAMQEFSRDVDVFNGRFKKCLQLMVLCVHPKYSERGIAQKLIKMSEDKGREMGCDLLSIQASNIITYHIATKLGFQEVHKQEVESLKDENGRNILNLEYMRTNGTKDVYYLTKEL